MSSHYSHRAADFDIGSDNLINKVKIPPVPQLGVISLYHTCLLPAMIVSVSTTVVC